MNDPLAVARARARSAREIRGPSPLVAIEDEAPAVVIVDLPLPEQLALGRVFIQYRTEDPRVVPLFGLAALGVSPPIASMHEIFTWCWGLEKTAGL